MSDHFDQHKAATAADDKDPLTMRLFGVLPAVTRWATTSPAFQPSRPGERAARGCLHPVSLLKIIAFLLIIVLFPLFALPMMLARLAQLGRTSFRYSGAIDMAAGEPARWGHGMLELPAGPEAIAAGVAAITACDPGFNAAALTRWSSAATSLLCQSVTSGDATPARTFMSNGLFRTHQALLELRARSDVLSEGTWQAVEAVLVQAVCTPLVHQVRVRVSCRGWRWERHQPSGVTLRGGPEAAAWSEDLTFGRSARATTPAAGGLPARRCPSCGAPLELDADGSCGYCGGVVTAGRYDWVLVGWQREPW
jgi:hypothetical protein